MNIAKSKIAAILATIVTVGAVVAGVFLGGNVKDTQTQSDLYKITVLESAHGVVTTNKTEAAEGEEIVLTVTPDENYELSSLTVNQKESAKTFIMPAEDVKVMAKFIPVAPTGGDNFGNSAGFETTEGVDLSNDTGDNPYISVTAGGPQYAYLKNIYTDKLVFETTFSVKEVFNNDSFPKFGIMLNGTTEMVKFYVDMKPDFTCESVGVVHQPAGGQDDWENAYSKGIKKLNLSKNDITLKVVRDGDSYYFYVNDEMVLCEKGALNNENTAVGVFSFNTGLKAGEYSCLTDDAVKSEVAKAKAASKALMGSFFGKSGNFASSDVIDFSTDHGANPYLVLDTKAGTPLYTYINDFSEKQYYFEVEATVTDILNGEKYPKFGIVTRNDKEMVKFYLDMNRKKEVSQVGVVHQPEGGKDDWEGQYTALIGKTLNLKEEKVKFGLLRYGSAYYIYVNDELIAFGFDLLGKDEAAGFFTFGTSLKLDNYKVVKTGDEFNALLAKAQEDTKGLFTYRLTQNFFKEKQNGVYSLETKNNSESKVDDVMYHSNVLKTSYYAISGKLTLNYAADWAQSRILISRDPEHEHVIALEKTDANNYQIFAMSKNDSSTWGNWRLISSGNMNGKRNSIDFEVIVSKNMVYFLIDDEICYITDDVSLKESTVKFSGVKKAETVVENLNGHIFSGPEELNKYLAKKGYSYKTEHEARINELYRDYANANKGGTLLLGNSHMDLWDTWEAQTGLTDGVTGYNTGIDLSTTSDWLYAYDKLVKPFEAQKYIIALGENDVNNWGAGSGEVTANLKALFEKIHADTPDAEIFYIYQLPSPANYKNGKFINEKQESLAQAERQLCNSLSYVTGIDLLEQLTTNNKQDSNATLFRDDKLHLTYEGYEILANLLYGQLNGSDDFGMVEAEGKTYKTSSGVLYSEDTNGEPVVEILEDGNKYLYLDDVYTEKFYFEADFRLNDFADAENYPKFGLMSSGASETVKFYLDVNKANKEVATVGMVRQPAGGQDDWTNAKEYTLNAPLTLATDTVKLGLLRDGTNYYFYVNDVLVMAGSDMLAEKGTVSVFTFGTGLTMSGYEAVIPGSDAAANTKFNDDLLPKAQRDAEAFYSYGLTTNHFANNNGVYTLQTSDGNQGRVDDVVYAGNVVREANYRIKGNLAITNAGNNGQARLLVSSDASNEYLMSLEKIGSGYQLFVTSKAGENDWNWDVRKFIEVPETLTETIPFEVIVIGNKVYFAVDDAVCYTSDRVAMTTSTVKFSGVNEATTTVSNLDGEVFASADAANTYVENTYFKGETFGSVTGGSVKYATTDGVDLSNDEGASATIKMFGTSPRYAYLNNVYTQKFYFETEAELNKLLTDNWPKFGLMVNGATEMVEFYLDIDKNNQKVDYVGAVHQPTGGENQWTTQNREQLDTQLNLAQDKVKLGLLRDGKNYYLYVNDTLVLTGNDLTAEDGAVGVFSFNSVATLGKFKVVQDGAEYQALLTQARADAIAREGFKLTTNFFTETSKNVFQFTSAEGNNYGTVDDLTYGGEVFRKARYSVKGKLTLTNAGDWGQSRILISESPSREHAIALERTNAGKYQIFTMYKKNESDFGNWTEILSTAVNGDRNSINFEVVVDQNKVYFLIDDVICYSTDAVEMSTSAVKFAGFNFSTTTVENLEGSEFDSSAAVQAYLATKSGANFGKTVNGSVTYQTTGTDLSKDYGNTPTIQISKADNYNAYLKDTLTDKFYFKSEFNVSSVKDGENHPKFGILLHSADEQHNFFVDMYKSSDVWKADKAGVVRNFAWGNLVDAEVSGMNFTGSSKVKLEVIRDGKAYYFYVNDKLVLWDTNGLSDAATAVGVFSFGTELTVSDYQLLNGDAANDKIAAAKQAIRFFDNASVDLSKDTGAHIGTVTVATNQTEFLYAKDFFEKDFYFETKIHINEIYNSERYPKFGIFAENADRSTREIFFVDMLTDKTSETVGRKTNDWNGDWSDSTSVTVNGMEFKNAGEYVTLGLKKENGRFFFYVNGEYAFYFDSAITDKAKVGVFGFNTGMEIKEYFVTKAEGSNKLLTLKTEGSIGTVALNSEIWANKPYVFKEMPEEFIGVSYIKNDMKSKIEFDVHKTGYMYVVTPKRTDKYSVADKLDQSIYSRVDFPGWCPVNYSTQRDYWIYERQIRKGETVTLPSGDMWHFVVVSELPLDPNLHQLPKYAFSDKQLAELSVTKSNASVVTVANGVYPITNRDTGHTDATYLQNLPEGLIGKSLIKANLNASFAAGEATVTKQGKVFLIASTVTARKEALESQGYKLVSDLKTEYGETMSKSTYHGNGYGLYVKDVSKGDYILTAKTSNNSSFWSVTIFGKSYELPAEPPVSIEITSMPAKTTYKLGETFDPTGMVIKGTDNKGNERTLDASEYITVPATFTADVQAVSVIVNDMVKVIPVTITDADGNDLNADKVYSTSFYTTQKAPLLNGSVKRSTPAEVIAAIQKMEADGATAFNVHLTELASEYRNYDSFKLIADCTEYPVMAIAYGDESTREYRVNMMKEAVRAGFDIVDIRMDTFDADSKASLTGTVFESANPNEVSMDGTVIEQQKALVQDFKDLGAEVLMSAHVGVSLTREQGIALAKEMEARGADVAKIVLGSSANSMQQEIMQTNVDLQNEVGIKFYYNASGTASKPYRTASAVLGSHMIFCYAEEHSTNLATYDYIRDLKEIYKDIPEAPQQMLKTNNKQKIDIVEIGKKIWTTKDYVFTSLPEAFIGKEFVKASYGVDGQTVDVTVQKPGYIYVLTNAYKTDNSQAELLDNLNYTKLDIANWKFCNFSGNTSYVWVYEKYVEAGEKLQLGQWSVVIASDTRLNLTSDSMGAIADADMAILKPLNSGASVANIEVGVKMFADRETYVFNDVPYWLAGKNYILGNYGSGEATATRGGVVYMITNTGKTSGKTRESYLKEYGFEKVDVPGFVIYSNVDFDKYKYVVYKKTVAAGDNIKWPSWAIPVFSGDLQLSDNLAVLSPKAETTTAAKFLNNVRLFNDRTFYEDGGSPKALYGKSYLYGAIDNDGSETVTGTVTKAGTVYVQIPVKTDVNSYKSLQEQLIADGFTETPYRIYRNNRKLGYAQRLYQKEVAVGDVIHYGKYNLVYFDTLNDEDYYTMPSVSIPANIHNLPTTVPGAPTNAVYTYNTKDRTWQGCPVITITDGPSGKRMWAAWFTGGTTELNTGNFAVLLYSDDEGATWVDPAVAIVHPEIEAQVTKPQLWTLENGDLWVSWTQHTGTGGFDGVMGTWAAICENPEETDISKLRWSEPIRLFDGRGNGKITVLNKGTPQEEWLTTAFDWIDRDYSKVYSSTDKGATWTFKGKAEVTGSTYNNAILTELKDGSGNSYLWMLLRQLEGNMKESFSYDGGVTWTNSTVSHIEHPNSAIYMGWTSSGKLLMINHKDFTGRNNLTAFLSEDGGKTWLYTLLLDERSGVSYPDVIERDGAFYVVYDYDRFNLGQMYMAKITEADIRAGTLTSAGSYLKHCFNEIGRRGPQPSANGLKLDLTGATVTASTSSAGNIEIGAKDAFDGNINTRWCASSEAKPQWLQIDLGDVYNLESIYVFFEKRSHWTYDIKTSTDGTNWESYKDSTTEQMLDVTVNKQGQARYIRLNITASTNKVWASVWEMEIYVNKDVQKPISLSSLMPDDAAAPEGTQPEATQPEATQPEATQPEATQPEATQPEATQPEATQPEATQPEAIQPEATQPEATQPEATQPEATQPEATQPEGTQLEGTQPEGTQPEGTQPEGTQPEGAQPEGAQPEGEGQ